MNSSAASKPGLRKAELAYHWTYKKEGAGNGVGVELLDPFIAWFRDECKEAETLAEQLLQLISTKNSLNIY